MSNLKLVPVAVGESCTRSTRVLRLCSVKSRAKAQSENWVFSIARTRCPETQCSLFPICCRLPKLDVAGSSPVSRSIFSITYKNIEKPRVR